MPHKTGMSWFSMRLRTPRCFTIQKKLDHTQALIEFMKNVRNYRIKSINPYEKTSLNLTLVVALVLGSSSLFAQKLGRINLEEIITLMPEYKEMMTNMEAYSKDLRDNLETIQVELNTKYNDFQKTKRPTRR